MPLSPEGAQRAAWIDFEGNGPAPGVRESPPPTLLGIRVEEHDEFWIVEELFSTCADRRGSPSGVRDLRELAEDLIARCEAEERLIVSWSEHDRVLLQRVLDQNMQERLAAVYENGKSTARAWNSIYNIGITRRHTLEKYMEKLGWQVPPEIGPGTVGPALKSLRSLLEEGLRWPDLTLRDRNKWRGIIRHNRHDLTGMERVVTEASRRIVIWRRENN